MTATQRAVAYLDSSALVKLVLPEPESPALRAELVNWPRRAASALVRTELVRACTRIDGEAREKARRLLDGLTLVAISDDLLDAAAAVKPQSLRTLDAVHLATALKLDSALGALVTYDERLAEAAGRANLPVLAPA